MRDIYIEELAAAQHREASRQRLEEEARATLQAIGEQRACNALLVFKLIEGPLLEGDLKTCDELFSAAKLIRAGEHLPSGSETTPSTFATPEAAHGVQSLTDALGITPDLWINEGDKTYFPLSKLSSFLRPKEGAKLSPRDLLATVNRAWYRWPIRHEADTIRLKGKGNQMAIERSSLETFLEYLARIQTDRRARFELAVHPDALQAILKSKKN